MAEHGTTVITRERERRASSTFREQHWLRRRNEAEDRFEGN